MPYVRFSDSVEVLQPDEEEMSEEILASMLRVARIVCDRRRHAVRAVHAKSHGILKGELIVDRGLPHHLAQGLFARPARYAVIVRLSTTPGDIQTDHDRAQYRFAMKVLGAGRNKVLPDDKSSSQDFLLGNNPIIPFGHVRAYREMARALAQSDGTAEGTARALSQVKPGANPLLDAILKVQASFPLGNILGQTFHSMAAIRYGEYIAKISAAPHSTELKALTGAPVDAGTDGSGIRDSVVDFFRKQSAEYSLRAQLCTNLQTMPIEDGSILWSEEQSPHQQVARLILPQQDAYSAARRVHADEVLSFTPWHALAEHRPLGSIMRIRRRVYEASSRFRHGENLRPMVEPADISELPD